jgi:antitoxin (DNA-binding transcriptional repressor) of toxin-antitoxin stability system
MTLPLSEAQSRLPELIRALKPGDELTLTVDNQPIARVLPFVSEKKRPTPGRAQGMLTVVAEDEEHLSDFEEYLP